MAWSSEITDRVPETLRKVSAVALLSIAGLAETSLQSNLPDRRLNL